ncbi:phosphate ABC transporter ATP-binding protein [soil metagenome]
MLFELDDVTYRRDGRTVIDGLSARIPRGASCVLGPSGSGKSTLLRLLNRLADPATGRVAYEGRDVRARDVLALRREVCLVPQTAALIEGSVADNVALGPRLAGHSYDSRASLRLAGLDPAFGSRPADRLSIGEQQRVMLARALALEPRVLLLDEPTSALDGSATAAVERTLAGLWSQAKISLVLVTHDLDQAERMASHVLRIEAGRVQGDGPTGEVVAAERAKRKADADAGAREEAG